MGVCAPNTPFGNLGEFTGSLQDAKAKCIEMTGCVGFTETVPKFVSPAEMSCASTGSLVGWTRTSDVAASVAGVADCASNCAGHTYFGLECPQGSTTHCQCANSLSGVTAASDSMCSGGHVGGPCVGPFVKGGYMMGAHTHGSVYLVTLYGTSAQLLTCAV